MTILFMTRRFLIGGLEQVIMDIASLAKLRGHRAIIGYAEDMDPASRSDVEKAGLEHARLPEGLEGRKKFMREQGVSIVNAHYSLLLAGECGELGIPFLQTIHNMYLWLDEANITRWRELDALTAGYVAVSARAAQVAIQRLGLPAKKISIVPNGTAPPASWPDIPPEGDTALRQELGLPQSSIVFTQAASFYPAKAQWLTVAAIAEARRSRPDIRLVLLGRQADPEYSQKTLEKILQLDLAPQVRLPGHRRDISRFFHLSRALLAPSFVEGWSLAIGEAVRMGLPVIATEVGGAREQLEGTDGILLPAFTDDFTNLSARDYAAALRDEDLHARLLPLLVRAILDLADRPVRSAIPPPAGRFIRTPEEACAEHLAIMRKLVASRTELRP